jgi:hypothetical protein
MSEWQRQRRWRSEDIMADDIVDEIAAWLSGLSR